MSLDEIVVFKDLKTCKNMDSNYDCEITKKFCSHTFMPGNCELNKPIQKFKRNYIPVLKQVLYMKIF